MLVLHKPDYVKSANVTKSEVIKACKGLFCICVYEARDIMRVELYLYIDKLQLLLNAQKGFLSELPLGVIVLLPPVLDVSGKSLKNSCLKLTQEAYSKYVSM